jgi:pimeloyl-ACP methyl ester carboxylesterase
MHLQPDASQGMDAQVADFEAVRAKLGLDKVALVGDSYGGMLVMAYAAEHPGLVAKLVLSDSAAPSWNSMVLLLPQTFPDIEEQDEGGAEETRRHDRCGRARQPAQPLQDDLLLAGQARGLYGPYGRSGSDTETGRIHRLSDAGAVRALRRSLGVRNVSPSISSVGDLVLYLKSIRSRCAH